MPATCRDRFYQRASMVGFGFLDTIAPPALKLLHCLSLGPLLRQCIEGQIELRELMQIEVTASRIAAYDNARVVPENRECPSSG
ncbi:hypothetical protein BC826DRAFT_985958 [Russula brevipes]|nr:hypothetical protein BC826DRAFT_985958 [Russula brevipes]